MGRVYQVLTRIEAVVAGTFLVMMVGMIFAGGVARSLGHPINWTIDMSTCLFAWACFLSADIAWRRNAMMSVDVVTDRLPPRTQRVLRLVNLVAISAFLVYLVAYGGQMAWLSRVRTFQGIPTISYAWIALSLPVGAALLLLTTLGKIRAELRGESTHSAAVDIL